MTLAEFSAMCAVDFALFCELHIPENCPQVKKWYEGMEARESAQANPGLSKQLGIYSQMMGG